MATKRYKPTSDGLRSRVILDYSELTSSSPEKSLLSNRKRKSGRNNTGRITVRHRGGGVKKKFRAIEFKRKKIGIPGIIKSIEYDPYRSSNIALVFYSDGFKSYVLATSGMRVGDEINAGPDVDIKRGNSLSLDKIPAGSVLHNIEIRPGGGAQLARSAGASVVLMAKGEKYASLKLPSGEVRLVPLECTAVLGQVGNSDRRNTKIGSAGKKRRLGWRPTVRGSVMNPCDHPHGGGEGRAPIGKSEPRTYKGKKAMGVTTRKKNNRSNWCISKKRVRR